MQLSLTAAPYIPTAARTGQGVNALFRGMNMLIRGPEGVRYEEVYSGSEDLSENYTPTFLTGTLALDETSLTIIGTGTLFGTQLHLGQFILADASLLEVASVTDDLHFTVARKPNSTVGGVTGYRLPILFDLNKKRAVINRGNAIEMDKGNILCVGDGILRVNGSVLNASLTASRSAQLAVFDPVTSLYTVYTLGMPTPTGFTVTNVAGGTKGMPAGTASLRFVSARQATVGYNNPSIKYNFTVAAGQRVQVTPPAFDAASGNDAWIVFGTEIDQDAAPVLQGQGPWYKVKVITAADIAAGVFFIEYLNAEVNRGDLLTFDNDAPVDSEFIGTISGYPIYVSCQGKGTPTKVSGTSPGPVIIPAKPYNIEAAPLTGFVPLSPPEVILGQVSAVGRLYLLTPSSLQIAIFTANTIFPVAVRPFWKSGFFNPYGLVFVNGTLYGWTGAGPTRSIAEGDEGSEQYAFAQAVEEITKTWVNGHVLVEQDPMNECVCYFHSADSLNDSGYWTTVILPFMLRQQEWGVPIVLSSTTGDMIVSGVASVNGQLEFLAGGRQVVGGATVRTYRFDTGSGASVPWYLASPFIDLDEETRPKLVKSVRASGKFTSANVQVHGAESNETINVTDLEDGTNSKSGTIALATTAEIQRGQRWPLGVKNLDVFAVRVGGTWNGTGVKDRVDEVVIEATVQGVRR